MKNPLWDKSDPRIFVYKNENIKWLGVTFNFAHAEAWLHFLAIIALLGAGICFMTRMNPHSVSFWVVLAAWILMLVLIVIYSFCRAERELKQYRSGNPSGK